MLLDSHGNLVSNDVVLRFEIVDVCTVDLAQRRAAFIVQSSQLGMCPEDLRQTCGL